MTHFGLLCPAAAGHLNPMTALGHELKQRGHRVTLVGMLDAQAKTLAAGLEFGAVGEQAFPLGSTASALAELGQLSGLEALRYTVELFKQQTILLFDQAPAAIRQAGIDALIIDQTSFSGSTIAHHLELPFVSVSCALPLNREPQVPPFNMTWEYSPSLKAKLRNQLGYTLLTRAAKPITAIVVGRRQSWGLPPFTEIEDRFSKLAQICQQPPEFEFPRQNLSPCFHFTGPLTNPQSREPAEFPWDKLTGQPLIYASLGTVQNQLTHVFGAIAAACQGLDAQLIIALGGGLAPAALGDLPGNPLVVGYAPQLELLQRASLTITHAGLNTVLESLGNGVPLVAIPIANDQPGVAARIAWTGTGEVVPLRGIDGDQLRVAITTVLGNPSYRENSLRLQASIRQAGGVTKAADIVERAIGTGQPVLAQGKPEGETGDLMRSAPA
ncbi:MAG: glycosyl transferase family 1 [Leptolyngbya sp. DLM2.Bin27]|nr:MAG: glycosyl transferase family 1 [Leptolyngbya sp. DLM2.Bin27]